MTETHEEVGVEFRCDAGHSDGVPCERPVHVRKGRLGLCGEHMDAVRFGLEADELEHAVQQVERWLDEAEGCDLDLLADRLRALLAELRQEHHMAMQQARRFLEYADGAK